MDNFFINSIINNHAYKYIHVRELLLTPLVIQYLGFAEVRHCDILLVLLFYSIQYLSGEPVALVSRLSVKSIISV